MTLHVQTAIVNVMKLWPLKTPKALFARYLFIAVGHVGWYRSSWNGVTVRHIGPFCVQHRRNGTYMRCLVCDPPR